jgi:hypothetical protein
MASPPPFHEPDGNGNPKYEQAISPKPEDKVFSPSQYIDLTQIDSDDDMEIIEAPPRRSTPVIKKEIDTDFSQQLPASVPSSIPSPDEAPETGPETQNDDSIDQFQLLQEFVANQPNDVYPFAEEEPVSEPHVLDSDAEDAAAVAAFKKLKRKYDAKKKKDENDQIDDIEYRKAYNAEEERKRLRRDRQAYQYAEEIADENSLFLPEQPNPTPPEADAGDIDEPVEYERPASQRFLLADDVFGVNDFDVPESEESSDDQPTLETPPPSKPRRKSKAVNHRSGPGRVTKSSRAKSTNTRGRGRGRGRGARNGRNGNGRNGGLAVVEADQFFRHNIEPNQLFRHNVIADAAANLGQRAQPVFSSTNKQTALTELIASPPEEQRDLHHGDKVDIQKALKMFRGAGTLQRTQMHSSGDGKWKLKGMNDLLSILFIARH